MRKYTQLKLRQTFNWEMYDVCVVCMETHTKKKIMAQRRNNKQFHENVIKFNWDWNIAGGHVSTSSSSTMSYVFNYFSSATLHEKKNQMAATLCAPREGNNDKTSAYTANNNNHNRLRKTNRDSLTDWLIRICFCCVVVGFWPYALKKRRRRRKKNIKKVYVKKSA